MIFPYSIIGGEIHINDLGIRHKFRDEVARYGKFRKMVLGKEKENVGSLEVSMTTQTSRPT